MITPIGFCKCIILLLFSLVFFPFCFTYISSPSPVLNIRCIFIHCLIVSTKKDLNLPLYIYILNLMKFLSVNFKPVIILLPPSCNLLKRRSRCFFECQLSRSDSRWLKYFSLIFDKYFFRREL